MNILFYLAAIIALAATIMVITRRNAVHALLYLIVSFLAVAVIFYMMGAPFIAALEIIVYAGAIMVLFVFVMMMLNLGKRAAENEKELSKASLFVGPALLTAVLLACFIYMLSIGIPDTAGSTVVGPKAVGISLFSTYLLGVEMAGMLLLAGLIGAFHLGRRQESTNAVPETDTTHKEKEELTAQ